MVAETKRTPRTRKPVKADAVTKEPSTSINSTPAVESIVLGANAQTPATVPVLVPAPAPTPPPSGLALAAQAVATATLQGVPLALTRGLITERPSGAGQSLSLPPWVGSLSGHMSSAGRPLSPDVLFLSLYQGIPVPRGSEFQTFGVDHTSSGTGMARLQKPFTITLGEGRLSPTPDDQVIMASVQSVLLGRDLFLVSFDRLRLYTRANSGKPVSDNIILEAYDPSTGSLVWSNPRISIAQAVAACVHGAEFTPTPIHAYSALAPTTAVPAVALPSVAVPMPPAMATSRPTGPAWFEDFRREAEDYGVAPATYITKKWARTLLQVGLASSEEEARVAAQAQVAALLQAFPSTGTVAQAVATVPAPYVPAAPVAPSISLSSTEGVAAAIGLGGPVTLPARVVPSRPAGPAVLVTEELPEFLGLEHLSIREWRPKVQERVLLFMASRPKKTATARQIREGMGLPTGCGKGTELEKIGNALKRFLHRLEVDGALIGEGVTLGRTYRLL